MLKKIQEHVMDPAHDFTKVLPFGKCKVPDARALTVTKAEVYDSFPYKEEISLDTFSKLICNSKKGATPNLRAWLHETDICKTYPQRKTAVTELRALVAKASVAHKEPNLTVELEDFITATASTATYDTCLNQ